MFLALDVGITEYYLIFWSPSRLVATLFLGFFVERERQVVMRWLVAQYRLLLL